MFIPYYVPVFGALVKRPSIFEDGRFLFCGIIRYPYWQDQSGTE